MEKFSVAAATVLLMVAEAMAPAPESSISEWIDQGKVYLSEKTNTPRPGPLSLEGVEYLREPLDRLHPDDPARRVTIMGGAQSGKSTVPQMWVCWSVAVSPRSFAIGLPSDGEVGKYNDYKLQPLLEDSEDLKPKVRPVSTKTSAGSSARKKNLYSGHSILIFNLNSPKELQMISTGNLVLEETANTLADVGGRGDPIKQARERQAAYSVVGAKECQVSTPGEKGSCAVTKGFEAGDQRRHFGKCQNCGGHFALLPENFVAGKPGEVTGHHFVCPAEAGGCGGIHEERMNAAFRQAGVWIPSFRADDPEANPQPPDFIPADAVDAWRARRTDGRDPSYYVWQAMCGLISWDKIASSIADAKTPTEMKALEQQTFGRAWDPSVEALSWEELHKVAEPYEPGIVPAGAGVLTAFCDVQAKYLQAAVYGWGPGAEWWVVDRFLIMGDTADPAVWQQLDERIRKTYPHAAGGELPIEAFGVDTGFRSHDVYMFTRGRPSTYALDGRPGWGRPFLGKPKPVRVIQNGRVVGRVRLFPSGTWPLKSTLAWSLKLSIEAGYNVPMQGRGHWSKQEDEAWCQEMTGEILEEVEDKKTGETQRIWKKFRKNEELDCWVGARALAWMLGVGAPKKSGAGENIDWLERAARRSGKPQGELFTARAAATGGADDDAPPSTPPGNGWFTRDSL